ncbi:MAG: hypothetical protein A2X25_09315 [Chloroflexi bacterium GWB2_49_20]|nr:MAG: hypothetical protein A2X25_09315 [Chloroflexi bacterium GWB2_49_20]OGN79374.1 MAG: hypothetical protein A2X26_04710 [Chloroflexi bacterium GWC2_49_37]OGN82856.1 MAG: hypothetical protein A2X27_07985 [Chloroflexi bacterium GWD2_49_16]HCC78506.1 pyruvate ferredoxin oxidoreductase [Anaerolineae bacterium]HCM97331.1 pyruvate ferredoxin oxidoreductase [Anaerolineae bacterium]
MIQIRFHGLGGQGVVSSAHLMGKAAIIGKMWANSLPFFTTSQRGGKVSAYTRIDVNPIDQHCYIYEPDILVLFHPLLLQDNDAMKGLKVNSKLLINTAGQRIFIPDPFTQDTYCLDADEISRSVLGIPVPSTVMVGALLRMIENITMDNLKNAVEQSFGQRQVAKNIKAIEKGFESCKLLELKGERLK